MFAVTVRFEISSDNMQFFVPLMHANAQASVAQEEGCLQFDVLTDPSVPGVVFLYEIYTSPEAFQTHLGTAHFKTFDAETAGMIVSKSVQTFSEVMR